MASRIIKGVCSTYRPAPHIEALCHMSPVSYFSVSIFPNISHDTSRLTTRRRRTNLISNTNSRPFPCNHRHSKFVVLPGNRSWKPAAKPQTSAPRKVQHLYLTSRHQSLFTSRRARLNAWTSRNRTYSVSLQQAKSSSTDSYYRN